MDKSNMTFQVFSSIPEHQRKSQNNNDMEHLAPTGIDFQSNEDKPQTESSNKDVEPLMPTSFQSNESTDKANDFQENLPKYKKICDKVYEAADVENNAAEVEPMLPPVIS